MVVASWWLGRAAWPPRTQSAFAIEWLDFMADKINSIAARRDSRDKNGKLKLSEPPKGTIQYCAREEFQTPRGGRDPASACQADEGTERDGIQGGRVHETFGSAHRGRQRAAGRNQGAASRNQGTAGRDCEPESADGCDFAAPELGREDVVTIKK